MMFDNKNKIAVNKQKIYDWVPNLRGSLSAESMSMPAKLAVKPVARPNSKPKATPPEGSKAVKSDSTSKSVASSSNQQNEMKKSKSKRKKKTKTNTFVKPQQIWRPKSEYNSCDASSSGSKCAEPPTTAGKGS